RPVVGVDQQVVVGQLQGAGAPAGGGVGDRQLQVAARRLLVEVALPGGRHRRERVDVGDDVGGARGGGTALHLACGGEGLLLVGQQRPHVGAASEGFGGFSCLVADDDEDRRRRALHGYSEGSRSNVRSRTPSESGGSSSRRKSRQRSASSSSPIAPAAVM